MSDERFALMVLAFAMGWVIADSWKIRRAVIRIEKLLKEKR